MDNELKLHDIKSNLADVNHVMAVLSSLALYEPLEHDRILAMINIIADKLEQIHQSI